MRPENNGATAGMDAIEDNHEQDLYLLIKDIEDRKKQREEMKMIEYNGDVIPSTKAADPYGQQGDLDMNNQLALMPM